MPPCNAPSRVPRAHALNAARVKPTAKQHSPATTRVEAKPTSGGPGTFTSKKGWQLALAAAVGSANLLATPAFAGGDSVSIGKFDASGIFFKDSVEVFKLSDLGGGVSLYLSDFKRSVTDKFAGGDPFSEPSTASVSCILSDGPKASAALASLKSGGEGDEIYSEAKGLNLGFGTKTLRIRRLVDLTDPQHPGVVYVSYSTRPKNASESGSVSSGRYKTSLCALSLPAMNAPNTTTN
mmetsp:Transcript_13/g.25  ORF Transcript_13/g.25 Transcript_13/m.25 type:complete len:237 (-) Transcript_13:29-739(-)